MPAEGCRRAVLIVAGGTVNAVSVLELEVQPDTPRQAIKIAEAAAETRMRTRTQYTLIPQTMARSRAQGGIS
jgi:hypothetical protein